MVSESVEKSVEKSETSKIKLTRSQENVLKQILTFVNDSPGRVFILKGYAGTGKTTLLKILIKELTEKQKHYRLLASTGRAVNHPNILPNSVSL